VVEKSSRQGIADSGSTTGRGCDTISDFGANQQRNFYLQWDVWE
jgi:hypothetical protein